MAVQRRRDRTDEILERYRADRARLRRSDDDALSDNDLDRLLALIREAIRLLRENKAECVRGERRDAERIGGQRWAETTVVDLGYEQVKTEIDQAIELLHVENAELRATKARRPEIVPSTVKVDPADDKLIKLLDLHQMGVLTADEFAAAKQRLR